MTTGDPELRKELDATLHTRRELGPDYEAELLDSFMEKLDRAVDQRVRRGVAERQMQVARGDVRRPAGPAGGFGERFGFAAVSLVLAVPLSAIGAANAGLTGLLVSWAGIVGVNVAQASPSFGRSRRERAARDAD
ncbi:hypothetical protein C3486_24120 [Streptomyces sp. Ru73]|uniref:hypothetical protein n=1 Tax=Streptomyces sp. Ru73 TaxID=2080748 RepID=UPI000CDDA78C|nr:hypothetical protein [Streptomyces sp. Ru73]POX38272.1 hypothetical protein C3486_24120 [Streptomyces sp. Ru73]